jgi:hypothetical protein
MGDCARTRDAQLWRAPRTGETISGPALLGLGRPHTRQRDWDKPRGIGRFKLGHPCCRFQPQHEEISASMAVLHGCSGALSAALWFWFTSWVARRSVDAIAGEQPHAGAITSRQHAKTIQLDLVNPAVANRRVRSWAGQARFDEARQAGTYTYHGTIKTQGVRASPAEPRPENLRGRGSGNPPACQGHNVTIEYGWAFGQADRLPELLG